MKLNKRMIENGGIQTVIICGNFVTFKFEIVKTIEGFYTITNLTTKKVVCRSTSYAAMRRILTDLITQ